MSTGIRKLHPDARRVKALPEMLRLMACQHKERADWWCWVNEIDGHELFSCWECPGHCGTNSIEWFEKPAKQLALF